MEHAPRKGGPGLGLAACMRLPGTRDAGTRGVDWAARNARPRDSLSVLAWQDARVTRRFGPPRQLSTLSQQRLA